MTGPNKNLGHLLGFCGVVLFGGTLPAARLAVVVIDSLLLIAARASTAGIAGITLLLVLRRRIPPLSFWGELFLAGLCAGRFGGIKVR
jgi:drug/metabolite transporter (DMT)-like permease